MNKLDNSKLISLVVYKLKDTLFNLMYDIADNPVNEIANPSERIKALEEDVRKLYAELIDCLDRDMTERGEYADKLNLLSKKLVETAVDINRYTCVNNQLGEYILREMKLIEVSHIDESIPLNNSAMAEKVNHYMSHLKDDTEGAFAKGQLMSAMPLRMTRAKYGDYIKKAFNMMAKELPSEFAAASMERLKDMFYAVVDDSMKKDFPLMSATIEEIYNLPVTEFDRENIEEYLNLIDDNLQALQNVYGCIGVLYNDVTYMKVISDFTIDSDFIFEDDFIIKDLYYSLCDSIRSGDNTIIETITENLSDEIEKRYEAFKELEAEITKAIDEFKDIDEIEESAKVSIQINNAISNSYLKDIDSEIMLGGNNEKTVAELGDDLVSFIEESVSNLPIQKAKYMKQKFFSHLPCPYTNDEIMDYTYYALSGVNDRNILLMACGDIFDITDKAEHDHCGEHHHNHDHCSGHHHDHCDCGHKH